MQVTTGKIWAGFLVVCLVAVLLLSRQIIQVVGPDELVVIQGVSTGSLTWHTDPGPKMQVFGSVTTYKKRSIYPFVHKIQFFDGGTAMLEGSIQYEMPTDPKNLTAIHVRFGSQEAVQKQLIETIVNKSIYLSGPLMSSRESYAEKRTALIHYVEDQVEKGVYQTRMVTTTVKDEATGEDKTATKSEIVWADGAPARQETAVLGEFGIKPFNFSITNLEYDDKVKEQIATQQVLTMQVQTSMAEARKAEQEAITVARQGEAKAMATKWEQEAIKAKEVTKADQERAVAVTAATKEYEVAKKDAQKRLEVSQLDAQAAGEYKKAQVLRGEGDAAYKKLVIEADGALAQKLATYEKVQASWAEAFANRKVPQTMLNSGSGGKDTDSASNDFMALLTMKTARDLALDMNVRGEK